MKRYILTILIGIASTLLIACGGEETGEKENIEISQGTDDVQEEAKPSDIKFDYIEEEDGSICVCSVMSEGETLPEIIEIPDEIDGKKVTRLYKTFYSFSQGVKEVIVPESVILIDRETFFVADGIEKITIKGAEKLEMDSISTCEKLEVLVIEEGTKTIESNVAYLCGNLKEVYLPASVEYISDGGCFVATSPDLVIYAPEGSYAYDWAKGYGFQVQLQ